MGESLRFQSPLVFFCALIALGSSACLDKKKAVVAKSSSTTASTSAGFTGATSAMNLASDGLSIQINWKAAAAPYTSYTIYAVQPDQTKTPIRTDVALSQTSYVQVGLTSGFIYSFLVRAVRADGTDDGNNNVVSTLAYAGINKVNGVTGVSLNSAFVNFPAVGSKAQGYTVKCTNTNGISTISFSVYNTTDIQKQVTGLYSGTTYYCSINAIFSDYLGNLLTDSNAVTYKFQTVSQSFTQTSPAPAYQGVILVQAFGDAPTAPVAGTAPVAIPTPSIVVSSRQVSITWKSFSGIDPWTAQYRLVRVREGGVLDMNATGGCTSSTITSCQVCVSTGGNNAISRTCVDGTTTVGKSPNRYDYAVSLIVEPSSNPPLAEELPLTASDAPFRINVPMPPDNMVLVHRDSVNYEICSYMGLTTDPQNNQRCVYSGLGAIPYSSTAFGIATPLSLVGKAGTPFAGVTNNGTFYDFGYNLFVDRWEMGCRWSKSTASGGTGMCGAGATPGDCKGPPGAPLGSIGVNGNIYVDGNQYCYLKKGGAWQALYGYNGAATFTPQELVAIGSAVPDPSAQVSSFVELNPGGANMMCQFNVDPNYGPKRMMRKREFVAAAAFQWMPGEPNQLTNSAIGGLLASGNHTLNKGCNNLAHAGVTWPGSFTNGPTELGAASAAFTIGSHYTAECSTRYGIQDLIGNEPEFFSDMMTCSTATHTCTGVNSAYDPGNRDLTFIRQYNFDGIISNTGPGGTSCGQVGPNYTYLWFAFAAPGANFCANYISVPMALPFITNDSGNATLASTLGAQHSSDNSYFRPQTDLGNVSRIFTDSNNTSINGGANSRLGFNLIANGGSLGGFRCVLPAE